MFRTGTGTPAFRERAQELRDERMRASPAYRARKEKTGRKRGDGQLSARLGGGFKPYFSIL